MHEVAGDELALLREYLNAVAAALTNIDEPVSGEVGAVKRGRELLLIGRRARLPVVRRRGIVVDFAERDAMAAPPSFELAFVVVHQHPLLVDDVDFARVFVERENEDA